MNIRPQIMKLTLASIVALATLPASAFADDVNCANEFRSGKLYFAQKVYEKAVDRFALAVETCPDKGEYRARYALALCEMGKAYVGDWLLLATGNGNFDESDTLFVKGMEFYRTAGQEFLAALETEEGQKRKLQKFVDENRKHYWVDNYNEGLELIDDEKYLAAAYTFQVARMIDPTAVPAYTQGARAAMLMDDLDAANSIVEAGLAVDAEDENLGKTHKLILQSQARKLSEEGDSEKDLVKIDQSLEYYDKLLAMSPDDPNLYFYVGLTALSGGAIGDDAEKSKAYYVRSAENFGKAMDMVPAEGENLQFHLDALFNRVQALLNAGNEAEALEMNRRYLCLSPLDPAGWQIMALSLSQSEEAGAKDQAIASLMMYKSLAGEEVQVGTSTRAAKADAEKALGEHGKPDKVFTYTTGDGAQVITWIWSEKKLAQSFSDGVAQGAVIEWCK